MAGKELAIFETRLTEWEVSHPRASISGDAASIISRQADKIIDAQWKAADQIVASQKRGFDKVASEVSRVYDGIVELGAAFEWGFSELIWRAEQQTKTLKQILDVLQAPLDTQGRELRKRAENAYANRWFDDALEDFLESERKNRYDFAVHISLGHIYFFEKKNPEKALEYYDKAVKYATPKSPQHASYALLHKGLIYYLRADFEKAYEAVLRATELSPDFAEAHFQCAHYCANLRRYDEAIEHLKKATLADRNYALKVWAEKDFAPMKEKLKSFFEQWREETRAEDEEAMEKVRVFLSDIESYGAGHTSSHIKAKENLNEAEALVKGASLFDCWDAMSKIITAKESAIKVPSEYLSEHIVKKKSEIQQKRKSYLDQHSTMSDTEGWSIIVVPIVIAITGAILTVWWAFFFILPVAYVAVWIYFVFWSPQSLRKEAFFRQMNREEDKVDRRKQNYIHLESKAQQLERELNLNSTPPPR